MSEDPAKRRFWLLQLIRMAGTALALVGVAIIGGAGQIPAPVGYVLLVFGAVDALLVPVVVSRLWKSKG